VAAGQTTQFTVTARGAPLLSYRWSKDGAQLQDAGGISGSRTGTLVITNTDPTVHAGSYSVRVSNDGGSLDSEPVQLTIVPAQLIPSIAQSGASIKLSWAAPKTQLETAADPNGPWTPVLGATSPFSYSGSASHKFFRLSQTP
jgi:hypothetical protein